MRQIQRSSVESHTAQRFDVEEPKGLLPVDKVSLCDGDVYLHTGHPEPVQFCKQIQWKTCWQGMVMRPFVSSMRSRQTGQVGSSMRFGVGGGNGLRLYDARFWSALLACGLVGVSNLVDFTKTT